MRGNKNEVKMKIKTGRELEENYIPVEIKKQISVLYELGLEEYEIKYLLYLETKEKAKQKWGG